MSRGSQQSLWSPQYSVLLELLKKARLASGKTQKEICDSLGKPRNYVLKIERGERRLDVVELFALCEAMGADPMKLLTEFSSQRQNQG